MMFLILLFTKPIIEGSGWLYKTKSHITHIIYQPFSKVTPPNYIALTGELFHSKTYTVKLIKKAILSAIAAISMF